MKLAHVMLATAAAIGAAGCGDGPCATETPKVEGIEASCVVGPGDTVSYPVHLCPTCNQTNITCAVDLSQAGGGSGTIFLDPRAEACEDTGSCPPSCSSITDACTFVAPGAGTYTVYTYDGSGGTMQGTLEVNPALASSCSI